MRIHKQGSHATPFRHLACALAVSLCMLAAPARAQSEASVALSMLPLASVGAVASVASTGVAAVSAAPLVLSAAGAVFTVRAVEVSAKGTVVLLERASDGAQVSVEIAGRGAREVGLSIGATVMVSVIGAGMILYTSGEAIAFIPNRIGQALLHNERLTY